MAANHDKGSKNKKGYSSKKAQLSNQEIRSKTMTIMSHVITVILGVLVGLFHMYHVSTLYENDRNFSHLSTMEREMGFRTEMGLYYSYFKTMYEAKSSLEGLKNLYANNITEYPDTINVLERFNLYPELFLGLAYRFLDQHQWISKVCWTVNRGGDLPPVQSCEGLGDPAYFYLAGVWTFAGLTAFFLFIISTYLSSSKLGGVITMACFFFNHEESTRVMWTPPLRESFGYPLSLLQILCVSKALNADAISDGGTTSVGDVRGVDGGLQRGHRRWIHVTSIAITTTLYLTTWQFAQFTLFTQVAVIFGLYALGLIKEGERVKTVALGVLMGLCMGVVMLFMNGMLLTSWLFSSLCSVLVLLVVVKHIQCAKPDIHDPTTSTNEANFSSAVIVPLLKRAGILIPSFLIGTFALKYLFSKLLQVDDDAHIFNILKSKMTDYRDFDTLLYTCAREFDFLGWEMPYKTTLTLLMPVSLLSGLLVVIHLVLNVWKSLKGNIRDEEPMHISEAIWYNIAQSVVYAIMAIGIMRLKLFLTPHLCILAGLMAKEKVIFGVRSKTLHMTLIFLLLGLMSIKGYQNLQQSYSRLGEYNDPSLEELLDWINLNTPQDASFAGPMPLMANLMLSTRRAIVNHPHYEDVALRQKTRKVYQMYSRRSPEEYKQTLKELQVHYVVLHSGWCLEKPGNPCAMASIMDLIEPERVQSGKSPLCPTLFHSSNPKSFKRVFANDVYVILKV